MIRFPFATYAKLLAPEQRDQFAQFSRGRCQSTLRFVEHGLRRAAVGLSLAAAPGR